MTLEELDQFQTIERLIEYEKDKLLTMRESLGLHSPNLSGMPKGTGARDKIGETMPEIVDKERELLDGIIILQNMRQRIIDWINALPNARLQLIAKLRFVDGRTWEQVADFIDDGKTSHACKRALYRYLESEQERREKHW